MAWIITSENRVISTSQPVVINSTRYSAKIFTEWDKAQLATIGIKPFREVSYNAKYYSATGFSDEEIDGEIVRTYTTEDKYTLEELKILLIDEANETCKNLLTPTDLYYTREEDTGKVVPVSIREERIQIRKMTDDNIATIAALETYNPYVELKELNDIVVTPALKNEYLLYSTKLTIRRALRAMGYETELDALVANPIFTTEWNDTTSIDFTEPLVVQALSSLTPTLDEIKTEIWALLAAE